MEWGIRLPYQWEGDTTDRGLGVGVGVCVHLKDISFLRWAEVNDLWLSSPLDFSFHEPQPAWPTAAGCENGLQNIWREGGCQTWFKLDPLRTELLSTPFVVKRFLLLMQSQN